MAATYPRIVKSFTTKPGLITDVMAVDVNDIQDEVRALEAIVGVNPLTRKSWPLDQKNLPATLAERLDDFESRRTRPAFSSWVGGLDDIAQDSSYTSTSTGTSWSAPEPIGIADSPDNYPGGMYGVHPATKPAVEAGATGIGTYGFEWNTQAEWVNFATTQAVAAGGRVNSSGISYPTTTSYSSNYTIRATSPTDANGVFTLPKPAEGSDPLGWYNGVNGFTVKKAGWYHLTGTCAWKTEGDWDTTRRLTIFGSGNPLAVRDVQGNVGISTEHKSVDFIGIIEAGTVITLGIRSFTAASPSLNYRAMSPRLSGFFLRGV